MKIRLHQNVLHEGVRHLAGTVLEVSEDIGAHLTSAGMADAIPAPVVLSQPSAPEAPKPSLTLAIKPAEPPASAPKAETCAQAESAAKKAAKKTAKKKKAAP